MATPSQGATSAALLVLVLCGAACGSKSSKQNAGPAKPTTTTPSNAKATPTSTPPIASALAPPLAMLKTDGIPGDAAFHAKVDDLAAAREIESSHIGAAGAQSPIFKKFLAVREAATPAQLVALLRHESPVVRGYILKDVVAARKFQRAQVVPLLADVTYVPRRDGCLGGGSTIAELVIEGMCEAKELPEAQATLLEAGRAPWLTKPRFTALACLGSTHAADVEGILREELGKQGQPADVLAEALRAVPAAGVAACAGLLSGPARHADANVRKQAAAALGNCPTPEALPLIEALIADDRKGVSLDAKVAHTRHPAADPARVKEWLADSFTAPYIAGALIRSDSPPLLELLVEHLKNNNPKTPFLESLSQRPPSPAYTVAMRSVLARIPTHSHFETATARTEALRYLAAVGDRDSLEEFRKAIRGSHPRERASGAQGLGKLGDKAAIPDLEALLADRDSTVVADAARALLALGSKESATKIEAAAAAGPGKFYGAELTRIVARLRGTAPSAPAASGVRSP